MSPHAATPSGPVQQSPAHRVPGPVRASQALLLVGLLLSGLWAFGATQGWWVDLEATSTAVDETEISTAASGRGWDLPDDGEELRRMLNGTSVVLAVVSGLGWVVALLMVRQRVPMARGFLAGLWVVGVLLLGRWVAGAGLVNSAALQALALAMLGVGLAATALLFLPSARRWTEAATAYRPV
ncbi:hypothetical protein SAMN05445756_0409 [Kytococcus aerolatus]|uniref:Uncharacterized protein n=1 Tax=Kytococcus aerolatus TaxID=592308 RepID=A0A212T4Y7_9MICO|nr:hypothetical protein [Kytococcus aerolatus]SNC61079.1 hypothetical protein SAMN05445756_0409 [Kytococcus aerolatus]